MSTPTPTPTLPEMITAARRELALRERAYVGWVRQGRMRQEVANHEIACMRGIVEELQKIQWLREASKEMRRREV